MGKVVVCDRILYDSGNIISISQNKVFNSN